MKTGAAPTVSTRLQKLRQIGRVSIMMGRLRLKEEAASKVEKRVGLIRRRHFDKCVLQSGLLSPRSVNSGGGARAETDSGDAKPRKMRSTVILRRHLNQSIRKMQTLHAYAPDGDEKVSRLRKAEAEVFVLQKQLIHTLERKGKNARGKVGTIISLKDMLKRWTTHRDKDTGKKCLDKIEATGCASDSVLGEDGARSLIAELRAKGIIDDFSDILPEIEKPFLESLVGTLKGLRFKPNGAEIAAYVDQALSVAKERLKEEEMRLIDEMDEDDLAYQLSLMD